MTCFDEVIPTRSDGSAFLFIDKVNIRIAENNE